jgi:hypothetical protein
MEIRSKDDRLIATIHDPSAFAELLDDFEHLLQRYSFVKSPLREIIPHLEQRVDLNIIHMASEAADQLRELRKRCGDTRDNLYPIDFDLP